ncbi:MAG: hypothetical protein K2M06_07080 [Muribaculaceae bacterium]|nr:hypothetical protein [Muribaculaceae bacterium]
MIFAIMAACFAGGMLYGRRDAMPPGVDAASVSETRATYYDTIPYYVPVARDSIVVRYERATVAQAPEAGSSAGGEPRCSRDSADVLLPVVQRHYGDSTYEAWVSGPIDPRLDSLRVYAPTTIVIQKERKPPKRWHIGPTIGYGYTPQGLQPYVGISITYSIISF